MGAPVGDMLALMLDLAIVIFGLRATLKAARLRWLAGVACGAGMLAVWALLMLIGWYGRNADDWGIHGAWLFTFFGPSVMAQSFQSFASLASMTHYATLLRGMGAALALLGLVLAQRRAELYSPLSEEADRWNHRALAFLAVLLLTGGELAFLIIAIWGSDV